MNSNVCNQIRPYLPEINWTNAKRFAIGSLAVGAYLSYGAPAVILGAGGYLYIRHKWAPKAKAHVAPVAPVERQLPVDSRPVRPAEEVKEVKGDAPRVDRIGRSARLGAWGGKPKDIIFENNSCFCSSAVWSFFTQEAVLGEIPEAIGRRLDTQELFPGGDRLNIENPDQIEPIANISQVARKQGSITQRDFDTVRENLQLLETTGIFNDPPRGVDGFRLRELLSLLELHQLIRQYQDPTTESLDGMYVNGIRNMVKRVQPEFDATGNELGDTQEVCQALGSVIFNGSRHQQNLGREPSWGDLPPMALQPGKSIADHIETELRGLQFDFPPAFLVVNLKRTEGHVVDKKGRFIPLMNFSAIKPDYNLTLDPKFNRRRERAEYELMAISKRKPKMAHYITSVKTGDENWYLCDDIQNGKLESLDKTASQGYLYYYRRVR